MDENERLAESLFAMANTVTLGEAVSRIAAALAAAEQIGYCRALAEVEKALPPTVVEEIKYDYPRSHIPRRALDRYLALVQENKTP